MIYLTDFYMWILYVCMYVWGNLSIFLCMYRCLEENKQQRYGWRRETAVKQMLTEGVSGSVCVCVCVCMCACACTLDLDCVYVCLS